MRRNKALLVGTSLIIAVALLLCTSSCGTILYPERRGQAAGQLDPAVAIMDGLGLLLFIVPGVIAFGVDFATGAIYLPASSSRLDLYPLDSQFAEVIQTEPTSLTLLEIESLVAQQIGQEIDLMSPETRVAKFEADRDLVWGDIAEVMTPDQLAAFEN